MRLTEIVCFANKKIIPTPQETAERFTHAARDTMLSVRKIMRRTALAETSSDGASDIME